MADLLKSLIDGVVGGVLSEIKRKTGVRTTRRKKRVNRSAATVKKIEELLLGKSTRKTARTSVAKKADQPQGHRPRPRQDKAPVVIRAFAFWQSIAIALCALMMGTAHAQQAPDAATAEPENSQPDAGYSCDMSDAWRVVGVENGEVPGMVLHVSRRDPASKLPHCDTSGDVATRTPDFTIGTPQDTLWLTGVTGDHLIVTRSTGPQTRLLVHRLTDKAVVLDVQAYEPDYDSWGITFWHQREPATADNCLDYDFFVADGLGGVIAHESRYDFATASVLESGLTRCEATQ
ncbi:MAG: hypothetical protein HC779_01600 [Phyllobacteriaceae bacterium]|nr:hypothetical protein [Phyllobacteriaceae bacterium]